MKKLYNQPQVTVAPVALQSNLLSGSPAPAGDTMGMSDTLTDDQW